MIFIAFFGPYRTPEEAEHPQESSPWMTVPLIVLAIGAAFAGFVGVRFALGNGFALAFTPVGGRFEEFLAAPLQPYHDALVHLPGYHAEPNFAMMYLAAALSIVGIMVAWGIYRRKPAIAEAVARGSGPIYWLSYNKYFIDELYDLMVVGAVWMLGIFLYFFDRYVIDGVVFTATLIPRTIGFVTRRPVGCAAGLRLVHGGFRCTGAAGCIADDIGKKNDGRGITNSERLTVLTGASEWNPGF